MNRLVFSGLGLHALETLSQNNTCIHGLHPMAKLVTTIMFVVTVVSFGRYEIMGLLPYLFYPAVFMAISETPYRPLLLRMLIAVPFCLFAGLANCIFDTEMATGIFSYGFISLLSIMIKMFLCVMAALMLISVTPLEKLSKCFVILHLPSMFVMLLSMIYRYIYTMMDVASEVTTAYHLRKPQQKGIAMKDMGEVLGQMLVRGMDKGERVYESMKLRGYDGRYAFVDNGRMTGKDIGFTVLFVFVCMVFRIYPLGGFFG